MAYEFHNTIRERVDQIIDELLEEGILVPEVTSNGDVMIKLSDKYDRMRCPEQVEVESDDNLSWVLRCTSMNHEQHIHSAVIRWADRSGTTDSGGGQVRENEQPTD